MYLCSQKFLSKFSSSSGVTLIELMVSLFVFAVGMLAVTAMCLMSVHGNSLTNRMTQANFLAQSKMEMMLSVSIVSDLDALDGETVNDLDGNGDAGGNYSRIVDVATDASNPDIRWITVNVNWSDSKGSHQVELKSLARGH